MPDQPLQSTRSVASSDFMNPLCDFWRLTGERNVSLHTNHRQESKDAISGTIRTQLAFSTVC